MKSESSTATDRLVPIHINRTLYKVEERPMTGREILAIAGFGQGYDLLLLQGEGDPSGGRLMLADELVEVRPGLHFRAIPGDRTFGHG